MPTFQDVVTPVTIANYGLGAWDGITKYNPLAKCLREDADWEYDFGGDHFEGAVEAGRDKPVISVPGMDLSAYIVPSLRYARWVVPAFAELTMIKSVDLGTLRRNSGVQALVKLRDKEVPAMCRDAILAVDGLLHQFLNQNQNSPTGNNAANGLPFAGLPTFLLAPLTSGLNGYDGIATSTGVAVAASDPEATPTTQTYNGQSLALNGIAGLTLPTPDAWTPTLVNTTSTLWNGSASASGNILTYLQWGANRAQRFSASDQALLPDFEKSGWLSLDYFNYLGNAVAAKQTIYIETADGQKAPSAPIGTNAKRIPHAGLMWQWDERMPKATGYIIPWRQVFVKWETLYMGMNGNGNPLGRAGEDAGIMEVANTYDPVRRQWITSATLPGQFACNPRYFVRFGAYA